MKQSTGKELDLRSVHTQQVLIYIFKLQVCECRDKTDHDPETRQGNCQELSFHAVLKHAVFISSPVEIRPRQICRADSRRLWMLLSNAAITFSQDVTTQITLAGPTVLVA